MLSTLPLIMTQAEEELPANDEGIRPYIESFTHSFVVKIWLEETPEETLLPVWRGHITHVATGHRRYVNQLDAFLAFMAPYLTAMGVKMTLLERMYLWLNRQK